MKHKNQPALMWDEIGQAFPLYELRDVEYKVEVFPIKGDNGPWTWTISSLDDGPVQSLAIGRELKHLDDCLISAQTALRDWVITQHRQQARHLRRIK